LEHPYKYFVPSGFVRDLVLFVSEKELILNAKPEKLTINSIQLGI
jgi:hypothetical protein